MVKSSAMLSRITIVTLLSVSAWGQVPQHATVIFYRPYSRVGGASIAPVFADGVAVGELQNVRYFSLIIKPGPHFITVSNHDDTRVPKRDVDWIANEVPPLHLDLSPGTETFVRIQVESCKYRCIVSLTTMPAGQARDEIASLRPTDGMFVYDTQNVSREPYTPSAATGRPNAPEGPTSAQPDSQPGEAAPAPATGSLLITTSPAAAQVYLDDEFKGTSGDDGKLVISGVATGQHTVRLTAIGYKQLKERATVAAGENPLTLVAERAGPKPLTEPEVEKALRDGVPKPRVEALVKEYGVDFALTNDVQQRLRGAGATDAILLAIATNRK